jgi:phage/plasmid-associated DNA primase
LLKAITDSQLNHASSCFGITQNIFNNTINIINTDKDSARTPVADILKALVAASPHLLQRIRFSAESSAWKDLYYCDPETNVWSKKHNGFFEDLIEKSLETINLNKQDRLHIMQPKGYGELLHLLANKVLDDTFKDSLDANLDLFAVYNGVFDSSKNPIIFRDIRPEDMIGLTAGWSYSPEEAAAGRERLHALLAQFFPVPEEREVVTKFFSTHLSGRRHVKRFIILTDRSGGNNGKTVFTQLITDFFGKYSDQQGTPFLSKASLDKGRDAHDAATTKYRGIRIVVAEEMKKYHTLDDGILKKFTGGERVEASGRKMNSEEVFKFTWQAGFVLIFNDGDCPKFDATDEALMHRMLVAPMRAKFVAHPSSDPAAFEFASVDGVRNQFSSLLSSLAELFMGIYHESNTISAFDTSALPRSMTEWKNDITEEANPFAEWLQSIIDSGVIEITGSRDDFIRLGALNEYKASTEYSHTRVEVGHVKMFFGQKYKDSVSIRSGSSKIGRERISVKNAIVGCKLNLGLSATT